MNLIADPAFRTFGGPASKWAVVCHEGVVIAPAVADRVLRLDISGTRGANWHGELRYAPIVVSAGESLAVSFAVRARRPFTFSVWLGQLNPPYASLVPEENRFREQMMTVEWQTFTHVWRPFRSEDAARVNFVLGQIDNTIEIKDVNLEADGA